MSNIPRPKNLQDWPPVGPDPVALTFADARGRLSVQTSVEAETTSFLVASDPNGGPYSFAEIAIHKTRIVRLVEWLCCTHNIEAKDLQFLGRRWDTKLWEGSDD